MFCFLIYKIEWRPKLSFVISWSSIAVQDGKCQIPPKCSLVQFNIIQSKSLLGQIGGELAGEEGSVDFYNTISKLF